MEPSDKANLDTVLDCYLAAMNALDESRFLACFRENALLRDPYGAFRYEGHDGLHQYFQTMTDTWQTFTMAIDRRFYGGPERVAFLWTVTATAKNGKEARYEGVGILTVEGALIDGLESYWDAAAMFGQIKD